MAARHAGEAWAALDAFHGRLAAEGLVRPGELGRSVGAIPVSGPLASLVKGRVLFCGDAAGLTHPITGAGIPQAVLSGRAAGQAAARWALHGDEAAPAAYEADLRGRFGRMLGWAMNKRREMERAWDEEGFSRLIERSWPAFREYRSPIRPESEP
jgi:flavin-dependent dehydrogenase